MASQKTIKRDKELQDALKSYPGDMPISHKIAVINGKRMRKFNKDHENKG